MQKNQRKKNKIKIHTFVNGKKEFILHARQIPLFFAIFLLLVNIKTVKTCLYAVKIISHMHKQLSQKNKLKIHTFVNGKKEFILHARQIPLFFAIFLLLVNTKTVKTYLYTVKIT
jgi:hypothetical protein